MKRMVLSMIAVLAMVGATATSALAISFNGPTVSISAAQYNFTSNLFSTSAGSDSVSATFNKQGGGVALFDSSAKLVVSSVNFSAGLTSGTGGGFSIYNSAATLLISGVFGTSQIVNVSGLGQFEASTIVTFVNTGLMNGLLLPGGSFGTPGLFQATLGENGTLALGTNWTTSDSATAQISSTVPEPASLILLGSGLMGLAYWRRKSGQA